MWSMAIELQGFDDLKNDLTNMAYALDQGPGVNRALKAGAVRTPVRKTCLMTWRPIPLSGNPLQLAS